MSFRAFLAVVGLVLVGFLGWSFFRWTQSQWIEPGYVGVMYSATSGVEHKVYTPKRVFVPWLHQLYTYPTMVKAAVYTQDPTAGESKTEDGIQVNTSDNANTTFDVLVLYRVEPDDVFTVFKTFGPIPIEDIQRLHIRRAVKEACNDVGPQYDVYGMMGSKRVVASRQLTAKLRTLLKPKGITIINAYFGEASPDKRVLARVTNTVNSLTELSIATTTSQIADKERQAAVTKAKAEARAASMTAAQASEKSMELLSLDATEEALNKWDGRLPAVQTKSGQTVLVPSGLQALMTPEEPAQAETQEATQ